MLLKSLWFGVFYLKTDWNLWNKHQVQELVYSVSTKKDDLQTSQSYFN